MENLCPASEGTCVHRNGGYAERVRANFRFVIPIPEALKSEHAAPLLCGALPSITRCGHMVSILHRASASSALAAWVTCHSVRAHLWRGGHGLLHLARQGRGSPRAGCAPLRQQPRIEGSEGSGRNTGFHSQHHQRRSGLGRLHSGASANGNALLRGRSTVSGLGACVSAHRWHALHQRQSDG